VSIQAKTCTCLDHTDGGFVCKHVYAASIVHQRDVLPDGTVIEQRTFEFTERKVTYKQNWPAYNEAQTTEKHRFQVLLHDLCVGIPQPARTPGKSGRNPVLFSDAVFAACLKVYTTGSSRRFMCDLEAAPAKGHASPAMQHHST